MSPDFYASYISGSLGILIGNPLDIIKVRLQSQPQPTTTTTTTPLTPTHYTTFFTSASSLARGTAAPILGYGALNALLFMTYNRTSSFLNQHNLFGPNQPPGFSNESSVAGPGSNLWNVWIAGAVGGLATWIISTPTELLKCRAQTQVSPSPSQSTLLPSTLHLTKTIIHTHGIPGLFRGGIITALRDSIGYGFYFWSYSLGTRLMASRTSDGFNDSSGGGEAVKVLLCGGVAGVVTWASVFPLDVVKTRVQTQGLMPLGTVSSSSTGGSPILSPSSVDIRTPLLNERSSASVLVNEGSKPLGAWQITKAAYRTEGFGVFWRGFTVCCVRAFIVNAVQWAAYEWIMRALDTSPKRPAGID